jgi:hypothetical protein
MGKKEKVVSEVRIVFSQDRTYYCAPEVKRDGTWLWLGVEKCPLPVPMELQAPGLSGAAVMRGRDYWRRFTRIPPRPGVEEMVAADDEHVSDYRAAVWWTPGIEEAWVEAEGFKAALDEGKRGKKAGATE